MRKFFLSATKFYQRYLSVLSYGSCRYYPTCSEYAKIHFMHNDIMLAIFASTLRVLRCNGLFAGGIDYPVITCKPRHLSFVFKHQQKVQRVHFWFIPKKKNRFYVIKAF